MNSVDNRFLRQQCIKTGLDNFVQSSPLRSVESSESSEIAPDGSTITRSVNRKVLSDVVEATLGAAVLTGGLPTVLETGEQLGLCFGGTTPWGDRPSTKKFGEVEVMQLPPALKFLEEALGYQFKSQGQLVVQALTHRSFPGAGYCYDREEYLGDGEPTLPHSLQWLSSLS
jgi:endoribonuclease Dicer